MKLSRKKWIWVSSLVAVVLAVYAFIPFSGFAVSKQIEIHYIDVGQADSILVELPNDQNMIIDAGNNPDGKLVVDYIKKQGIKRLDYVVGTHPHEDHIGGLDDVIKSFDVGKVYLPKKTSTTKTYRDVLAAIKSKGLTVTEGKAGVLVVNDKQDELKVNMVGPVKEYNETNDNSIVAKIAFKKKSFLFTGDAEQEAENDILNAGYNVSTDVLKVGHHGSRSSTSQKWLDAVNPSIAVISVGADNKYGHPTAEVLKRLEKKSVKVHRTDKEGIVVISSDGNQIWD
jgi:competence protein ComEC